MSSTFLTRLRVGDRLVDTKGVSRLYRAEPEPPADACADRGGARHPRGRGAQLAADRAADRSAAAEARRSCCRGARHERRLTATRPACSPRAITRSRSWRSSSRSASASCWAWRSARRGSSPSASKDLEKSLRGDLDQARSRSADLRRDLAQRREFERQAYPALVGGLLPDWRIGIVAMNRLPSGYVSRGARRGRARRRHDRVGVRRRGAAAARRARGELDGTKLRAAWRATTTCWSASAGASVAQLAQGGELGRAPAPGAVLDLARRVPGRGRHRAGARSGRAQGRGARRGQDRFESALIDAAQDTDVEVVGVEKTDTDPSQVSWFADHGVTSVDDLDLVEGKVALVWALLGAQRPLRREGLRRSACCRRPPSAPAAPEVALMRWLRARRPRWRWPRCWRPPCSRGCRRRAWCARTTAASCCPRPRGC